MPSLEGTTEMEHLQEIRIMPCAGLANRMRAIASAAVAAQEAGATLTIGWKYDPAICVGDFRELFDTTALPPWIKVIEMGPYPDGAWNSGPEVNSATAWITFQEDRPEEPIYQFKSWAAFYKAGEPTWVAALRLLRPHTDILEQVSKVLARVPHDRRLVGVHIRRTDHRRAIAQSPSQLFWAAMRAEAPETFFYVASDSQEERAAAAAQFEGRVITAPIHIARDTASGCRDALVDFICLAACSKVLGAPASSFCEIAAAYGGVAFVPICHPLSK